MIISNEYYNIRSTLINIHSIAPNPKKMGKWKTHKKLDTQRI